MSWKYVEAGELMAKRGGTVDPSKFPDEVFELHSIPAFDAGRPEIVPGREIGSAKQIIQADDVMISKIVPHIRRASVVGAFSGYRQIGSGEWIVFRDSRFFPAYLRHFLMSDDFNGKFMATVSGVGGSLLRARPAEVAKIKIPLPPLEEQRRIAAILDKADALRAMRREAIAILGKLLNSVFLDMFGDPAENPKTWPIRDLSEAADLLMGYAFKSSGFLPPGQGIKLCRGTNVIPSALDWTEEVNWVSDAVGLDRYRVISGDIVIAMDRPWISTGFKAYLFSDGDPDCLLVQRVARLRPRGHFTSNFLYDLICSGFFRSHCRPTETTVPHISPNDFRSFPVFDPGKLNIYRYEKIAVLIRSRLKRMSYALQVAEQFYESLQRDAFAGAI